MPLTQTQRDVLVAAKPRPDHRLHPLPDRLRGGAAKKTLDALVARGLAAADGPEGALVATEAGLAAIGIEPEDANTAPAGATDAPTEEPAPDTLSRPATAPKPRTPREGTKQATLIALLRESDGATIEEIMAATGWQSHTVRGAMSGALKKKLGLEVTSEKVENRGRVYTIRE
tara:strand:- start:2310 stop:2828 length:519 start_codon:yes stop_codon:yes gene_type:complete